MGSEALTEMQQELDLKISAFLRRLGAKLKDAEAKLEVLNEREDEQEQKQHTVMLDARLKDVEATLGALKDQQDEQERKQQTVILDVNKALGAIDEVREQIGPEQFPPCLTPSSLTGCGAVGQQAVVAEAAMQVSVAENGRKIEEHDRSLLELGGRIDSARLEVVRMAACLEDALDGNQKIVSSASRSALEAATLVEEVHQAVEENEFLMLIDGSMGGSPIRGSPFSVREPPVSERLCEQDRRIDRLIAMVEDISERFQSGFAQLSAQCDGHLSKEKEHEQLFDNLWTSLEGCERQILDLSEGAEGVGSGSARIKRSPNSKRERSHDAARRAAGL